MSVRRFVGANSREAMRMVREAIGDDAMIVSNMPTDDGRVEIMVMVDETSEPPPAATAKPAATPYRQAATAAAYQSNAPKSAAPARPAPMPPPTDLAAISQMLLGEMQDMREMMKRHQAGSAALSGCGAQINQRLLGAGFSPWLCSELLASLPRELADADAKDAPVQAWLARQMAARLTLLEDENRILDEGGVIALVGPTGIGKTTTTAKLAARYAMHHGCEHVALVSTDSYRIGAHEQLRIYADLMGVDIYALGADEPLDELLAALSDKRLVIIDTTGMSQRDQRLVGQIAQLQASDRPVRLMLLLNAASHGDTLEEVVTTYQCAATAAGAKLLDCTITKSDEAARLGPALDVVIRHGLCLHYIANGQQVPEDLQVAEVQPLLEQALAISKPSPFVADLPQASSGQRLDALSRGLLGQGRALAAALEGLHQEVHGFSLIETAWQLDSLPRHLQGQRLTQLLEALDSSVPPRLDDGRLVWGRAAPVKGAGWNMPLLALDRHGRFQARPWLAHQLPAGQDRRLVWAHEQLGATRHLLPGCPDGDALLYLSERAQGWACPVRATTRVELTGDRFTLAEVSELADPVDTVQMRHRGRLLRVALRSMGVEIRHSGSRHAGRDTVPVQAWIASMQDADTGLQVGMRYSLGWLPDGMASAPVEQVDWMRLQLQYEELPALTMRAWQALDESGVAQQPELRLFIAAGLAATASRLDRADDDWAMDVRAQLIALSGGKRQRSATQQLDALLHLMAARNTFRQLGSATSGRG